jgi:hypothetical protein
MSTKPAFQNIVKGILYTEEEERQSQTQEYKKE